MNTPAENQLFASMPNLVLALNRDGTIISHGGGRAVRRLIPPAAAEGQSLESVWPSGAAQIVRQLVRKAIAARGPLESSFMDDGQAYRALVTPEGPNRAVCVVTAESSPDRLDASVSSTGSFPTGSFPRPCLERRGFLRQFQELVATQTLTERPLALLVVHLGGVEQIAQIDTRTAEQVVTLALMRLTCSSGVDLGQCRCIGQLSESQLAFALEVAGRQAIDSFARSVLAGLNVPIEVGNERFELNCHAGVAMLGRDANTTKELLDCARLAAGEARRAATPKPCFFSDTLKMASRSRQDMAGELREAIASGAMQTRCVGRHDLASGELVGVVAYARWLHPLRGSIAPAEFLNLAEVTGESVSLSRAILRAVGHDFARLSAVVRDTVHFSYGPLRRHLLHDEFLSDLRAFLQRSGMPAARFEVRIAESLFVSLPAASCADLEAAGIRIVIDEVGRGTSSLDRLARSPIWGMQLDRAWIGSICSDDVARRVCGAGIASATALHIVPVATGVDQETQRQALLQLGCRLGSGDLFPAVVTAPAARRAGDVRK